MGLGCARQMWIVAGGKIVCAIVYLQIDRQLTNDRVRKTVECFCVVMKA